MIVFKEDTMNEVAAQTAIANATKTDRPHSYQEIVSQLPIHFTPEALFSPAGHLENIAKTANSETERALLLKIVGIRQQLSDNPPADPAVASATYQDLCAVLTLDPDEIRLGNFAARQRLIFQAYILGIYQGEKGNVYNPASCYLAILFRHNRGMRSTKGDPQFSKLEGLAAHLVSIRDSFTQHQIDQRQKKKP